jgi:WD40 repeat protein
VKTGKELQTLAGHEGGTNFVTFFPDSKVALSTGDDEQVKVWFVAAGTLVEQYKLPFPILALTPDGNRFLACYGDPQKLGLWNARTGNLIRAYPNFKKHGRFLSITIAPDGKLALLGHDSSKTNGVWDWSTVQVWDMHKGEIKLSLGDQKGGMSPPLVFSPDSKVAIANHSDGTPDLWEVGTGKIVRSFTTCLKGAHEAAFGPGGKQVVIGDFGG